MFEGLPNRASLVIFGIALLVFEQKASRLGKGIGGIRGQAAIKN
jgi:hypothetical protein